MGFNVKISAILCIFAILNLAVSTPVSTSEGEFNTSLGSFSQRIFSELFKSNSHKNIIISPFAIQTCLAMTRMGADGETAVEMDKGLGFTGQTPESVADNYYTMLAKYEDGKILHIANKVYVMEHNELADNFKEVLSKKFLSTPENIDFEQAVESAKTINNWVESETNNKIKDLISSDSLSVDTRMVLLSAIHFKALWKIPFPQTYTQEKDFYTGENKSVKVPTMLSEGYFDIAILKDLGSSAVRMHFKDSDLSMLIILPDSRTGLAALEQNLRTVPLKSLKTKLRARNIEIYLPKFEEEFEIELTDTLKEMGMRQMFTRADFGKMLKSSEPLYVSRVVHKTYISVNEIGCEATGAAGLQATSRMIPPRFTADHPFYYAIINEDFVPLFEGTIVDF